jgi:DNA (cytosine-5)-methyltransferase 1
VSRRPILLDLFCGPGGATEGYRRAGFDVVGVDIEPWDCYPGEQFQADAMAVLRGEVPGLEPWEFDAIHASPPCHAYSVARHFIEARAGYMPDYPDLYGPVVEALRLTGAPFVVENVPKAPASSSVTLCGTMFGLPVRRHRIFEYGGWEGPWMAPASCNHKLSEVTPVPYTAGVVGRFGMKWPEIERAYLDAMGLDWVPVYAYAGREQKGALEAIPPAYTEWIGRSLVEALS